MIREVLVLPRNTLCPVWHIQCLCSGCQFDIQLFYFIQIFKSKNQANTQDYFWILSTFIIIIKNEKDNIFQNISSSESNHSKWFKQSYISLTDATLRSSSLFGPLVPSYLIEYSTKHRISRRILNISTAVKRMIAASTYIWSITVEPGDNRISLYITRNNFHLSNIHRQST